DSSVTGVQTCALPISARALDEAINVNRGGTIAVFTHTGTACILGLHLMGALDAPQLRPVWLSTANCGINRFHLHADGFLRVRARSEERRVGKECGRRW